MGDVDKFGTYERANGRLCHISYSNNKNINLIQYGGSDDSRISKAESNGKVQSALCDIVRNSRTDICQNNDDKSVINEEYLDIDRVLNPDHSETTDEKESVKGIRCEKHQRDENARPCLHVQFHKDEEAEEEVEPPQDAQSSSCSGGTAEGSSSDEESSTERFSRSRVPDGGWGWVVVCASFFVNLIADGVTLSFGIMFMEFLHYFEEARGKTACIGSLFMAMPLLSGPIASFLTDRFGCRRVSIFGSILAAFGFIVSSFTDSIEVLFLTFGIISGFGLSLCYVAAVVIVAYYFESKRSFATGLSACGSGIGTFVFAPLTQFLLGEYGWKGTTLILAGFFLNMCVCGALMRDLPWTADHFKAKLLENRQKRLKKRIDRLNRESQNKSSSSNKSLRTATSSADSVSQHQRSANEEETKNTNGQVRGGEASKADEGKTGVDFSVLQDPKSTSLINIPTFIRNGERVPLEVLELLSKHKNVYQFLVRNYPSLFISSRSCSDSGLLAEQIGQTSQKVTSPANVVQANVVTSPLEVSSKTNDPQTSSRENVSNKKGDTTQRKCPTAYLKDLRVHRHSLTYRGAMLNINRYRLRASSCPDIYRNSITTIAKEQDDWYDGLFKCWDLLVMLDLSYFLDIRFLLFSVSNFLLYTWYDVPYVYLADNAHELGFSQTEASYLISVLGILNMIGEIVLGWAGDRANANLVYAGCMFLCGVVTALVPLLTSRTALYIVSGAFGLFVAANYSLTSIILVDIITIERFTNAYGLLLLVQGIANLVGPPLAGWIYDVTNSYDLSFYLAGAFISISGIMLLILPLIDRLKAFRRERLKMNENWESDLDSKKTNCV